jgi:hypothetical protein
MRFIVFTNKVLFVYKIIIMTIKNNKKENIKNLEIEKEKTRQLAILRDIKKIELKLLLEKKYQKKNYKNLNFFKACIEDDSDCEENIDINFDTISMSSSKSKENSDLEEVEIKA